MEAVEGRWQVPWYITQEVAGHNEDLQAVGTIEHVFWQTCIRQLVVMEIDRPAERFGQGSGVEGQE